MLKESDIVFESGDFWVLKDKRAYTVFKCGVTHSVSVQAFALDADGLSCAVAYATYLVKRISK